MIPHIIKKKTILAGDINSLNLLFHQFNSTARSAIVLNSEAYKILSEPEAFCIDCVWKLNTAFYHNFRLSNHFILRYEKPLPTIDKIWSSHNFRLIQTNVNEGHNGMGFNMWTLIALCKYGF